MKKCLLILLTIIGVLCYENTWAARGQGSYRPNDGWGHNSPYNRIFNPASIETLRGNIVKIDLIEPFPGMSKGVHLLLVTEKETIPVHVGPEWYLMKTGVKFQVGDNIIVKGSRVILNTVIMIAAEITRGDHILKLRDDSGFPIWGGWRRR